MPIHTYERLAELLAAFHGKRVLVVGDLMLDRNIFGTVERINPEAPWVSILRADSTSKRTASTGGAGNVAKNIAALGAKATLVGVVGTDSAGFEFMTTAEMEGYTLRPVSDPSWMTVTKTRFLERGGHHLLRFDEEPAVFELQPETAQRLMKECLSLVDEVEGILVSDYAKGVVTRELAHSLVEAGYTIPLLADIKPPNAEYFDWADMMSPNEAEARAYLGPRSKSMLLEEVACEIAKTFNTVAFLTAAERGMYVSEHGNKAELVPQRHKIEVFDTSGCGDTAAAVILLATLCGAAPLEAAELANAAAAVVASKIGAVAPTPEEVLDMLRS